MKRLIPLVRWVDKDSITNIGLRVCNVETGEIKDIKWVCADELCRVLNLDESEREYYIDKLDCVEIRMLNMIKDSRVMYLAIDEKRRRVLKYEDNRVEVIDYIGKESLTRISRINIKVLLEGVTDLGSRYAYYNSDKIGKMIHMDLDDKVVQSYWYKRDNGIVEAENRFKVLYGETCYINNRGKMYYYGSNMEVYLPRVVREISSGSKLNVSKIYNINKIEEYGVYIKNRWNAEEKIEIRNCNEVEYHGIVICDTDVDVEIDGIRDAKDVECVVLKRIAGKVKLNNIHRIHNKGILNVDIKNVRELELHMNNISAGMKLMDIGKIRVFGNGLNKHENKIVLYGNEVILEDRDAIEYYYYYGGITLNCKKFILNGKALMELEKDKIDKILMQVKLKWYTGADEVIVTEED